MNQNEIDSTLHRARKICGNGRYLKDNRICVCAGGKRIYLDCTTGEIQLHNDVAAEIFDISKIYGLYGRFDFINFIEDQSKLKIIKLKEDK